MRLFAKDFTRSLLLGFAIGTLGMGLAIAAKAHVEQEPAPAAFAGSVQTR